MHFSAPSANFPPRIASLVPKTRQPAYLILPVLDGLDTIINTDCWDILADKLFFAVAAWMKASGQLSGILNYVQALGCGTV
jgi:hypothetical protein